MAGPGLDVNHVQDAACIVRIWGNKMNGLYSENLYSVELLPVNRTGSSGTIGTLDDWWRQDVKPVDDAWAFFTPPSGNSRKVDLVKYPQFAGVTENSSLYTFQLDFTSGKDVDESIFAQIITALTMSQEKIFTEYQVVAAGLYKGDAQQIRVPQEVCVEGTCIPIPGGGVVLQESYLYRLWLLLLDVRPDISVQDSGKTNGNPIAQGVTAPITTMGGPALGAGAIAVIVIGIIAGIILAVWIVGIAAGKVPFPDVGQMGKGIGETARDVIKAPGESLTGPFIGLGITVFAFSLIGAYLSTNVGVTVPVGKGGSISVGGGISNRKGGR